MASPKQTASPPDALKDDVEPTISTASTPVVTPSLTSTADGNQASAGALLGLALLGGVGYLAWKLWNKFGPGREGSTPQESRSQDRQASTSQRSAPSSQQKNSAQGGRSTFDKPASGASSSAATSTSKQQNRQAKEKPKTQKQLRKEAKEAKKAKKADLEREKQGAAVSAAIAQRAEKLGLNQKPEPEKQYYVDYDGVQKGWDKIVQWQQTGKKDF